MLVDIIIICIFAMPINAVNVLIFVFQLDWIGVSYKGSTKVFGSFSRGSIPLAPTKTHVLIYRNTNYSISDIKGKGKGKEIAKITFLGIVISQSNRDDCSSFFVALIGSLVDYKK